MSRAGASQWSLSDDGASLGRPPQAGHRLSVLVTALLLAVGAGAGQAAMITYNTWTTNEGDTGNYILTVNDDTPGQFAFNLTVDPWNAEALGLFLDFGDFDLPSVPVLSNVSPAGEVIVFATDTSSDNCGQGCNLSGLSPPIANPDGEWELVFRLGEQGFDGIQTFSFATQDFGLGLGDLGLAGIRAQQLCDPGELLPNGDCGGSDKSYGSPGGFVPPEVPAPAPLFAIGLGALILGWLHRRSVS